MKIPLAAESGAPWQSSRRPFIALIGAALLQPGALAAGSDANLLRSQALGDQAVVVSASSSDPAPEQSVTQTPRILNDCDFCPELVVIPPGEFRMGTPASAKVDNETGETPPVPMTIPRAFALGRYEVTRRQFETFAKATGFEPTVRCRVWSETKGRYDDDDNRSWRRPGVPSEPQPNHPVSCVSWEDAQRYVRWLAQETELPYRLPTEAEWEYGARAGSNTLYPWGENPQDGCRYVNAYDRTTEQRYPLAWTPMNCEDGFAGVAPVGSLAPNAFGLYDMLGNVWEFAEDCATRSHLGRPGDGSAWVWEGGCARRIQRGGGWITSIARIRPGYHGDANATHRFDFGGFRVARDLSNEEISR